MPDRELAAPDAAEEELTTTLLLRAAERYGMRTDATDWQAVTKAAARARRATATLAAAAGDGMRALPPLRP